MNNDNRFDELDKRLKAAEDTANGPKKTKEQTAESEATKKSIAIGLRMGTEFVAGVLVGVVFGLLIDHYFGTSPWGFIILFILGSCAGFANVYRAVNNMGYRVGYNQEPEDKKTDTPE